MTSGTLSDLSAYLTEGYWSDTSGYYRKWNLSDTGINAKSGEITYSLGNNWYDADGINSNHATLTRYAFQYLENITGINFTETSDGSSADIAFGNEYSGAYASLVSAHFADVSTDPNQIYIDTAYVNITPNWYSSSPTDNDYLYQTILHEIGHLLGLGHQSNYNGSAIYPTDANFDNDCWSNSIMSYFSQITNTNIDAGFAFLQTFMVVDFLALDALYGNQSYAGTTFGTSNANVEDTTYGFNSTILASDDYALSNLSENAGENAYCIVDGGGNDTLDCSGWSADQLINLTVTSSSNIAPTTSNIAGLTGNLTLALNTVIENAVGGSGDDIIIGNEYSNYLDGGDGDDQLFGGDGDDIFDWDPSARNGSDTFYGGAGDDLYIIGTYDVDTIVELDGEGDDSVQTFTSYTLSSYVENLTLLGSSDIDGYASNADGISNTLTGNSGNNILYGYSGDDTFYGGGGADALFGGDGTDYLLGQGGDDSLWGGNGADFFYLSYSHGADVIWDFDESIDSLYIFDGAGELSAGEYEISYDAAGYRTYTLSDSSSLTLYQIYNNDPTGSLIISGTAAEGSTLSLSDTIADADGLGSFSYKWLRDGSAISGATSPTYVLTQDDVGANIAASVTYTDGYDTEETVTSAETSAIANVNADPTGSVTISGTAAEDHTLTLTSTVADADGIDASTVSYQWYRDGSAISGATSTSYTLTQDDVGAEITAKQSYTDDFGNDHSVTSTATSAVSNVNDAATGSVTISGTATEDQTLTLSSTVADADGIDADTVSYQWYRDGSAISGATSSTYVLTQIDVGAVITAEQSYTDDFGNDHSVTSAATSSISNVNDAATGSVTISGTAAEDHTLTLTSTVADADGIDASTVSYQWYRDGSAISGATSTSYTLTQDDVGAEITAKQSYTDDFGNDHSVTSTATSAVSNVNDAATGSVTISGTATEDQTLTLSSTVADADGIDADTVSYQWYRDGSAISGATSSTYVLTQIDVGAVITAEQSYTDDFGNDHSVTSAATSSISNVNDAATGSVTISGVATEDQTLTLTSTVADADGIDADTVSYQWLRDGSAISGATDTSYTLTQDDVGAVITAEQSYTDDFGNDHSVTSAATGAIDYGPNVVSEGSFDLSGLNNSYNLTLSGSGDYYGYGNDNDNSIIGNSGANTLRGNNGNDLLYGQNGNDTIYGGNNNDKLYGGNNNDKLQGGNGNDKSYGQAGNDSLYMDAGNDTLDGGTGTDWLFVTGSANSVVNLAKTTGQNTGYGTDIIKNIENASGGTGVDKFYGTTGNNTLKGNNGNDILQGMNGNDTLQLVAMAMTSLTVKLAMIASTWTLAMTR